VAGKYARKVSPEEKAARLFEELADGERLTLRELVARTKMSRSQVYQGWAELRRYLGRGACIVEPHRQATVYYLSDDYDDGARYILWQSRHVFRRIVATKQTVKALQEATQRTGQDAAQPALAAAHAGLVGATAAMDNLIRELARQAGHKPADVERWLKDPAMIAPTDQ
jgi:DNA-binding transcriptional regulator GbsR (MarR family)